MAHELDFTTGRAAIAYSGRVPWHGHGIQLDPADSMEEWRRAAGLDWEVEEKQVYIKIADAQDEVSIIGAPGSDQPARPAKHQAIKGQKALIRDDTGDVLSIVSDKYHVAQPSAVFGFFNELLKNQGLTMNVAGSLKGGTRIWALGRIDDTFTLHGRDQHIPYVLMATSFDGSMSTQAMLTNVRVVCNNTMTFAGAYSESENPNAYKVPHNRKFDIEEAHGKLGLNEDAWLKYKRRMEQLAAFQVSPEQALEYFYTLAGGEMESGIVRNEDNGNVVSFPEPNRTVKQFINAYHNGPGSDLESAKDTAFGLLNAVTFYQDHMAPAKDSGSRFNSSTFGGGNVRKQHALGKCLEMLEVA